MRFSRCIHNIHIEFLTFCQCSTGSSLTYSSFVSLSRSPEWRLLTYCSVRSHISVSQLWIYCFFNVFSGILMPSGLKHWLDHNGVLLWRTQLWAHQPGGAVSSECAAGAGQVRSNAPIPGRFPVGRRSPVLGSIGVCVQVSDAGLGLNWFRGVRLVRLGPPSPSAGRQNRCPDPHRGHHFSRASRWPKCFTRISASLTS